MTTQQGNDLIANVKDVKDARTAEAARIDTLIETLKASGSTADPVVAQAITDLGGISANIKAFHADTVIPPVTP